MSFSFPSKNKEKITSVKLKTCHCYVIRTAYQKEAIYMEGSYRTPRDEEIRIHPFSPRGKRGTSGAAGWWRERGCQDGRRHSKNPLYQHWSCFLSRKRTPRPTFPLPPPSSGILNFVYENCPLKWQWM